MNHQDEKHDLPFPPGPVRCYLQKRKSMGGYYANGATEEHALANAIHIAKEHEEENPEQWEARYVRFED